ncbi:MAG: alpha/beta hydrolase, partial [Acidobacteria bacterium]|nr:alpha/beta hydrolase [Acidobacteriota bacterium]
MKMVLKWACAGLLLAFVPAVYPQAAPASQTNRKQERRAKRAKPAAQVIKPDYADLSYGPYPADKLDLWLAKSATPTPLVVFIHGGGFVAGDKGVASPVIIRKALDAGVSFAAINYRFRTEVPIQVVLRDCARAVQFLRYKAKEFNIDKTRVGAMGGSAGAGTSLWLAFHNDLADPKNPDPVLRESTRLTAAASTAGQATYDILRWEEYLGDAVARYTHEADLPGFYGLKTMDQVRGPEGKKIRADVDMLGLITKDDSPVYLTASKRNEALVSLGAVYHTPKQSVVVKQRCDQAGVPAVLKIVDDANPGGDGPIEFLLSHL